MTWRIPDKKRQHAFTLIELLMILAVFSFVLACASVTLATMWRAQRELQDELANMSATTQLVRQLRADAHLASAAELVTSNDGRTIGVTLSLEKSLTRYEATDNRVTRVVQVDAKVVHRETFALHDSASTTWALTDSNLPRLLVSFTRPSVHAKDPVPAQMDTIEIAVNIFAGEGRR